METYFRQRFIDELNEEGDIEIRTKVWRRSEILEMAGDEVFNGLLVDWVEDAVARYHAGAISAVEMIQELLAMAKDMQVARNRGAELGLSPEEVAFYMALAENKSALEAMGDEKLRVIAHELLDQLRSNATVDWQHRESARARMRVLVKRILKKYGYPPDLADEAVQTVLAQAEILLREIT